MASDDKKTKPDAAAKIEGTAKTKSTSNEAVSTTAGGETAPATPSSYSRGERQKPVTAAYRENWNAIFLNNKSKKKRR
jgi:hypothetical protein